MCYPFVGFSPNPAMQVHSSIALSADEDADPEGLRNPLGVSWLTSSKDREPRAPTLRTPHPRHGVAALRGQERLPAAKMPPLNYSHLASASNKGRGLGKEST